MADLLHKYRCHKIVEAAVIRGFNTTGMWTGTQATVTVQGAGGADTVIGVPGSFFARAMPAIGDYFVRYEDGYESFSPKKAFEDGYTLVATLPADNPVVTAKPPQRQPEENDGA